MRILRGPFEQEVLLRSLPPAADDIPGRRQQMKPPQLPNSNQNYANHVAV